MSVKTFFTRYWEHVVLALLAMGVFCFWLLLYPFIPVAREVSLLFLWNTDYLLERLATPGGLARYLGEGTTQFFLNPVNGSIVYAVLFVVAQLLTSKLLRQFFPAMRKDCRFVLSLIPSVILWRVAMLPLVPLTPTMAVLLVMGAACVIMTLRSKKIRLAVLCVTIPVMYWLTGPAAILLVLCCIRWIPLTATWFAVCLVGSSYLVNYPLGQVARGIDYYWSGAKEMGTNKTTQMFHTANNKRIEVYDAESDVFIYDTQTHTILKDTLTMRQQWAENTPAFSPDGQWLYYTTALRRFYPPEYDKQRYSLCRVSFDEKTGHLGVQVDTLINAAVTGKSVSWPRPSYDGHYLMYTQLDYGYFSIWHPEADLWLMDLTTGQTRPLDEVNSTCADSQHSWSSNSRWFLFTSRRDDGLYTRIFFSMMGDDGRATKPFMLPQRNPRQFYRRLLYSYNTPDFTSRPVNSDARQLGRSIESGQRTPTTLCSISSKEKCQ